MTRALEAEGVAQDRGLRRGPEALRPPGPVGGRGRGRSGATGSPRSRRSCGGVPGVTVIVYDQRCAAEARRLRKRGELAEPPRRVVINEAVCEGCGDCSTKSNCLSVLPLDTEFGEKRQIHDLVVQPRLHVPRGRLPVVRHPHAEARRGDAVRDRPAPIAGRPVALPSGALPTPATARRSTASTASTSPGIGGTGVVTANRILAAAAEAAGLRRRRHGPDRAVAEGRRGRVAPAPGPTDRSALGSATVGTGGADLYLSGDILQAAGADPSRQGRARPHDRGGRPRASRPPRRCCRPSSRRRTCRRSQQAIAERVGAGPGRVRRLQAHRRDGLRQPPARQRRAARRGLPAGRAAARRSPTSSRPSQRQGQAAADNREAFEWGRWAVHDPAAVEATPRRRRARPTDGGRPSIFDPSPTRRPTAAQLVVGRGRCPARSRDLLDPAGRAGRRLPERGARPSGSSTWSSARPARDDADHGWALTRAGRRVVVQAPHLQGRVRGRPPAPARSTTTRSPATSASRAPYSVTYHLHPPVLRRLGLKQEAADGQAVRARLPRAARG